VKQNECFSQIYIKIVWAC